MSHVTIMWLSCESCDCHVSHVAVVWYMQCWLVYLIYRGRREDRDWEGFQDYLDQLWVPPTEAIACVLLALCPPSSTYLSLSSTGCSWYQGRQWTKRRKGSKGQSADCYLANLVFKQGSIWERVWNKSSNSLTSLDIPSYIPRGYSSWLYSILYFVTTCAPPCAHFLQLGWRGQARKDWFFRTSRKKGTVLVAIATVAHKSA